jgi:hypothetical protein
MAARAFALAPDDAAVQLAYGMLAIDAHADQIDELVHRLPTLQPTVAVTVAVHLAELEHPRTRDGLDALLGGELALGEVAEDLLAQLGEVTLLFAPDRMARLVLRLPSSVELLADLGWKAIEASQRDHAIALYERLLALPIPAAGDERTAYLRALNNACIQAHAARAFETAVRIANRAQPVAHENPHIYHAAACAYAAVGDHAKAFEQVKLAIAHDYDHLGKVEVDADLGPILDWPEFKALFREWRARQGSN